MSGAESVGLLLVDQRSELRYVASSDEGGKRMEMLQLRVHDGPCLDCFGEGKPVVNADLDHAGDPVAAVRPGGQVGPATSRCTPSRCDCATR